MRQLAVTSSEVASELDTPEEDIAGTLGTLTEGGLTGEGGVRDSSPLYGPQVLGFLAWQRRADWASV